MLTTIPYTYVLTFEPTSQRYYGVRYAECCHPDDLWDTYFTSSKHIHKLIKEYGKMSFNTEIRKIFPDDEKARLWENKVLRRLNVIHNNNWLNKSNNFAIEPMYGASNPSTRVDVKKKLSRKRKGKHMGAENTNARSVIVDNIYFGSRKDAADYFGVGSRVIRRWIKIAGSTTCVSIQDLMGSNNPNARLITVKGKTFGCRIDAAAYLNISLSTLNRRYASQASPLVPCLHSNKD